MPEIRCPHCGKPNPDFLDVCQFCQNPLKTESTLHIGEQPTKKNTGELENVLPDWLKDVRQQARNSTEEDAAASALKPKVQKEEPPDLLAGLAFQSENTNEEEVPDWLSSLSSTGKQQRTIPSTPAPPENDFFSQFSKSEPAPKSEPKQEESPSWMSGQTPEPSGRDELSEWFTKAAEEPAKPVSSEPDLSQIDAGWGVPTEPMPSTSQPAPKEEEDLSWLHNLEQESKKTGELSSPKQGEDWFAEISNASAQSAGEDDLSWLNNLGSLPAADAQPSVQQPSEPRDDLSWLNDIGVTPVSNSPVQKPSEPKEDLSWLNNFDAGPVSEPVQPPSASKEDLSWLRDFEATPPLNESTQQPGESNDLNWLNTFASTPVPGEPAQQPSEAKDDLSWLNDFGAAPASKEPAQQPAESNDLSWLNNFASTPAPGEPAQQPSEAKDDLSWLNDFGAVPGQTSQPASQSQDDLSWLSNLQGGSEALSPAPFSETPDLDQPTGDSSQFTPRQTAPLNPDEPAAIPDWLKSASEGPSMPVNAEQLDQFREDYKPAAPEEPFSWKSFVPEARQEDESALPTPERAFVDSNDFMPPPDASTLSNKDVDSLFSVDMPDWLSQTAPEETPKTTQEIGIHDEGGEALAPVDLPSWVQAMRPVEAVIAETAAVEDQPTEQAGPLKGFKGVLPAIPIGSSRRPQPIPLKLQATAEQQSSAAIMEQILASEMSPRALLPASTFASQRALRQVIAFILFIVVGAVIFLRTQVMPISPVLPADVEAVSRTMEIIPDNSSVLVVVDYEPSLTGEMEAASGPVLNHLALLRHPRLSFISTSSNGAGLVARLMRNTSLSNPDGLAYTEGQNYFNLGYLPGGESGILSFVQSPQSVSDFADPSGFSQYSAVILLTDHSDSARSWIEQLHSLKQADPSLTNQPLLVVSSAQAGPMLQPYVSSRQINGLVNGLADAARYETKNSLSPGVTRSYWDAFGVGIILAVALIVLGSLWSLFTRLRASRTEAGEA